MNIELDAKYFGKEIYTYDHKIDKCSKEDVKRRLYDVDRLEMLRLLSDLSTNIYDNDYPIVNFNEIPVSQNILNMASLFVVKYTTENPDKKNIASKAEYLIRMCQKIVEVETLKTTRNPDEMLILIAYQQFPYQEANLNQVSRAIFIYTHLWNKTPEASHINILDYIEEIIGIPYTVALLFTYMIVGSKQSYLFPFNSEYIEKFNLEFKEDFSVDSHKKYLAWCSGDYSQIKKYNGSIQTMEKYPMIQTDSYPNDDNRPVLLVSNKMGLFYKLTNNLYFSLIEKFNKGKGRNEFKTAFGFVFEKYVGELLKSHFESWEVIPEIIYSRQCSKTSDWFLFKDSNLLIIEVKQSSIFNTAKTSGDLKQLQSDLKKTLIKGAKQINRTVDEINTQRYPPFNRFKDVKNIQSMIIVHDQFFQANSIGRTIIEKICKIKTPYHIIGISEFENFLAYQKDTEEMFDVLKNKSNTETEIKTDFKEYLIHRYNKPLNISFLKKIHSDFFNNMKKQLPKPKE